MSSEPPMAPTAKALKQQFDRKTLSLCRILENHSGDRRFGTILVVGCGDGREAATLAGHFGARTTGIDIAGTFDAGARKTVDLRVMDATDLDFPNAAFDLVYSFHALEHIPDDRGALREMNRVLRRDGLVCIGTPNRRRLVGYVGSATDIGTKIRWNLADLTMRMQGRFRNECGAHAGYTRGELMAWCAETFGHAVDVTDQYYLEIYKSKRNLIRFIIGAKLHNLLFPCVYVLAGKKGFDKSSFRPASVFETATAARSKKHDLMLRFRKRRNRELGRLIETLPSPVRVLDVGGTPFFWESIEAVHKCRVTILNKQVSEKERVHFEPGALQDFELRIGDACAMPEIPTDGFDLVVCNSVLEHVGSWGKMVDAAREIVRVGKHGWVQVPAFEFPLEVHHLIPFVHWFGTPIRRAVVGLFYSGTLDEMRAWVDINLVTAKEMRALFPAARVTSERFLLLPKSHIAVW